MKLPRNTAELLKKVRQGHFSALVLLLVISAQACSTTRSKPDSPVTLTTFEPDGCTCVPDGPRSDPERWLPACTEHDLAYWKGGSRRDRLNADRQLRAEIKKSGHRFTSEIYFIGTRFGGSPYFPTPWRWGFGRPWPSAYRQFPAELSDE